MQDYFMLLLVVALVLNGCLVSSSSAIASLPQDKATPPRAVRLGRPFDIRLGESVRVDGGLSVRFERVASDSRCPTGAACGWAGDAVVNLRVDLAGDDAALVELHTSPGPPNESVYRGYRVRLEQLMPHPKAEEESEKEKYTATLVVEKPG